MEQEQEHNNLVEHNNQVEHNNLVEHNKEQDNKEVQVLLLKVVNKMEHKEEMEH